MRTERLLREVVRRVLAEDAGPPRGEVFLSSDDIMFSLEHNPDPAVLHGVEVYTPFRVRKEMPSRPRGGALADLSPFDVVSTAKYGSVEAKDGKRLTAEPGAADEAIGTMADRIARRFEDAGVVTVTCVDSSHGMAAALARAVAERLGKPYEPIVKKTADPNVSWDPEEWEAYANQVRSTGLNGKGEPLMIKGKDVTPEEYLAATMTVMGNELDQAKRQIGRGEKPSLVRSTNMKTGHKRFFNFFDKVAAGSLVSGSKVLVVDDNIDSGWTPFHVAKRVRAAGLEPLFAAGFKMMRYYDKKAPAAAPKSVFQVGNLLVSKFNSAKYDVKAGDTFKVLKVSKFGVELSDVDTGTVMRLPGGLLDADNASTMWSLAA